MLLYVYVFGSQPSHATDKYGQTKQLNMFFISENVFSCPSKLSLLSVQRDGSEASALPLTTKLFDFGPVTASESQFPLV